MHFYHTGAVYQLGNVFQPPDSFISSPQPPQPTVNRNDMPTITGTIISSARDLDQSLQEIGDWDGLCTYLRVRTATMNVLRHEQLAVAQKKLRCLTAFYNHDVEHGVEVNWETVVKTVREYPISNKRLADKIAQKYLNKHAEL